MFAELPYFHTLTYVKDAESNRSVLAGFAIDIEKQYMIIYWNQGENRFLVCTGDEEVDLDSVVLHFSAFFNAYDGIIKS